MGKYIDIFYHSNFTSIFFCFRTYKKELITAKEVSNVSKDLAVTHLAIFERFINEYGHTTYTADYVASCITFMSKERVPPGVKHNVRNDFSEMCSLKEKQA